MDGIGPGYGPLEAADKLTFKNTLCFGHCRARNSSPQVVRTCENEDTEDTPRRRKGPNTCELGFCFPYREGIMFLLRLFKDFLLPLGIIFGINGENPMKMQIFARRVMMLWCKYDDMQPCSMILYV